jgi:hypothetical protein
MEAVRTSETSVYFNETTRRCIPESCHRDILNFTTYVVVRPFDFSTCLWKYTLYVALYFGIQPRQGMHRFNRKEPSVVFWLTLAGHSYSCSKGRAVDPRNFSSLGPFGDSKSIVWSTMYSRLFGLIAGGGGTRIIRTLYFIHRPFL